MHLIELLNASATLFPDRAAAIHGGGSVTFRELPPNPSGKVVKREL